MTGSMLKLMTVLTSDTSRLNVLWKNASVVDLADIHLSESNYGLLDQ
jgi:hypothetical protein